MFCNKCGAQLPDDAKFCNKCGSNAEKGASDRTSILESNESSIHKDPTFFERANIDGSKGGKPTGEPRGGGNKKSIVLMCLVFFVVAAVISCAFLYFGNTRQSGVGDVSSPAAASVQQTPTPQTLVEVQPKASLEEYSWEEIAAISKKMDSGSEVAIAKRFNIMETTDSGDGILSPYSSPVRSDATKTIVCRDGTKLTARIVALSSEYKCHFIFLCNEAVSLSALGDVSSVGWSRSEMRKTLTSWAEKNLPDEVFNNLKEKRCGDQSDGSDSGEYDKVWIPTARELYGVIKDYASFGDGVYEGLYDHNDNFSYFKNLNVDAGRANQPLVRNLASTGKPVSWWVKPSQQFRSGDGYLAGDGYCRVREDGSLEYTIEYGATDEAGIVFGFYI